jgi:hypothetical protein
MLNHYIKPNKEFNINADLFINPLLPEVIYTMGLLWADGNIHIDKNVREVELTSTYPDGDEFYKIMSSYGKWNYYKYNKQHKNYKHLKPRIIIKTNNRPLTTFFSLYDYKSKSVNSADKILNIIPTHLHYYWFRGLFDGDGGIYIKDKRVQITISGPYEQSWNYLTSMLTNVGVTFHLYRRISNKNHKCSYIQINGAKNSSKFLSYIYKNAETDKIYLTRKYKNGNN